MKNTNQMYLSAQEVANILGMSESYAYTVIRKMNDELKARGCITIAGKIPTKYFEEKFFGVQVIQQKGDDYMNLTKDKKLGTWLVQFYYTDWQGKKKKKLKRGFRTKAEATQWAMDFL